MQERNQNHLHPKKNLKYLDVCTALSDGWYRFGSKLFKLIPEGKTWDTATLYCQSTFGGELVSINNEDENEFISHLLDQIKTNTAGQYVAPCV